MELGEFVGALELLRVGDEVFVRTEKSGLVKYREERCPFLEVDVDTLVRKETRWHVGSIIEARILRKRLGALNMEEGFRVEVTTRFSTFLYPALEGF